ncbi:MAG: D-glycero-beta-D-manno-heptose-7-phosphate kinase [Flavobacteriales bacterium]|nr:D-glycero-beta-D-manno-heptose-7-phosphate kinase [Flavobacteriales bacterium]NNK80503.1 D-glycero-beta-D-manno-heptose-7-phosphate kinase [Flavobacteriales bacterium]
MTLGEIVDSFITKSVLIIGDVMIDAYIWGEHTRMSPEAPVPVVDVSKREARLGGAANVALNVKAAGARPTILTVLGEQGRSNEYLHLMEEESLATDGVVLSPNRKATVKTRVISNNNHLLRVDEEDKHDLSPSEENALLDRFDNLIGSKSIDVIILQDYNKGVLTESLIIEVIRKAKEASIPTMVDPKFKNFTSFTGCSLFKPNLKELIEGLDMSIDRPSKDVMDTAIAELQKNMAHLMTMVTLSEHGVYWNDGVESGIIPVFERNIVDVSGAGDTVISIAALAMAAGATLYQASLLANLGGGLVCEHVGVQPLNKEALKREVLSL